MHQFKINGKQAFDGDVWQWHQDYGTWRNDDQMPEARAMNVAIFLDEVNEFNGPLMFIPGSHKQGVLDAAARHQHHQLSAVDDRPRHHRASWSTRGGIVAPKGPAGSMILFHGCLVHASTSNLSPWNRVSVYLRLCAVSNHIRRFKRPGYIAHRDFTPIECLPDDCLLKHYDVPLPWKNGTPATSCMQPRARACEDVALLEHESVRQAAGTRQDKPLRVGLIGAGKFGSMYLAQVPRTPGVHLVGIADLAPDDAKANLARVGWQPERYGAASLDAALKNGTTHLGEDWQTLGRASGDRHHHRGTGNPIAGGRALPGRVPQRQARRQGHGRGRCVLRAAAGAQGGRGRRGLHPRLRRPAGADLRPGRLGARRRLPGGGRRPRPQVAAALRAVDARDGVGLLRPDAGAGEASAA